MLFASVDGYCCTDMPVGDVKGDDKVDVWDISLACDVYGSTPEDPGWNPNADINRDEIVNIRDGYCSQNFGSHTQPS